jgi:hypothetical protein
MRRNWRISSLELPLNSVMRITVIALDLVLKVFYSYNHKIEEGNRSENGSTTVIVLQEGEFLLQLV